MMRACAATPGPRAYDTIIAISAATFDTAVGAGRWMEARAGSLLDPGRWPRPMRALAERGYRRRLEVAAVADRLFRRVAPEVVMAVLSELDLAGIAREVIEEVDLPEIIRTSSGSVVVDAVHDARVRVIAADDAVSRWTHPRRAGRGDR